MEAPPKLQNKKSLRFATTLNFIVPGAGQFYLGQRLFGGALAVAFLACCVAVLVIFLRGYAEYMRVVTGGDVFQSGILERLGTVFHVGWLLGLTFCALAIFAIAMIGLAVASKRVDGGGS